MKILESAKEGVTEFKPEQAETLNNFVKIWLESGGNEAILWPIQKIIKHIPSLQVPDQKTKSRRPGYDSGDD